MLKKNILLAGFVFIVIISSLYGGEKNIAAIHLLPADTLAVLEIQHPDRILSFILKPSIVKTVTSMESFKQYQLTEDFKHLQAGINYLEIQLGLDWKTGLKKLLGRGITAAITSSGSFVLIIDADDKDLLSRLNKTILFFARQKADKQGNEKSLPPESYRGTKFWQTKPGTFHALVGNRLILSNSLQVLQDILDRQKKDGHHGLAYQDSYRAACKAVGSNNAATLFVNMGILKQNPAVMRGLTSVNEPMQALFFAAIIEAVRDSSWLALGIQGNGNKLTLKARLDNTSPRTGNSLNFSRPKKPGQGLSSGITIPGGIASLSLYRDLYSFYKAKDDLFPERTSSLIFFENMMGIFFSGRDLTEEVFAELKPDIQVVVAEQKRDAKAGVPRLQLPAFALVFQLYHPDKFALVMEEAWQKAIGLVNFTRGQQAQAGLIIDRPIYKGIKFTTAYFSNAGFKEKTFLPVNFNFQPSLAVVKNYMVLSSTEKLTRQLIDALLSKKPRKMLTGVHSRLSINGGRLASILKANKENLIQQNMLEKGHTHNQAEHDINMLFLLLNYFKGATLEIGQQQNQASAELCITVNLP